MVNDKIIGVIGGGNMGSGIISGIIGAGLLDDSRYVYVSDINTKTLKNLKEKYAVRTTTDSAEVCEEADIIFLVVKPYQMESVIQQIRDSVNADALVISVAAGLPLARIESMFGRSIRLVRMMPNLGALVGESMTGFSLNVYATEEDRQDTIALLNSFGRCEEVPEKLMDVVTGVSGSAPAYICTMLDAMADAAVLNGMPRAQAYTVCAQAMLGTAKYLLETGVTPSALKDMVCTPGGTSIEAVVEMENKGIRSAIVSGVNACVEKSKNLL